MLKKLSNVFAPALLLVLVAQFMPLSGQQQKRGPSTAEERQRAIELATKLEDEPLSKDAKQYRSELALWLAEVPDISVSLCSDVLGNTKSMKGEYSNELVGQLLYSQAKFVLENPDKAQDDFKVYVAGVEGVLRTYKALRKAKPKIKFDLLEDLLQRQEDGLLSDYVKAQMDVGCQRHSDQ